MTAESWCRWGRDNRHLPSDTHSGFKCLFSSPRVYRKKRGVSGSLRSGFNHTIITAEERVGEKGQELGAAGVGGEWTEEEEVGTKTAAAA